MLYLTIVHSVLSALIVKSLKTRVNPGSVYLLDWLLHEQILYHLKPNYIFVVIVYKNVVLNLKNDETFHFILFQRKILIVSLIVVSLNIAHVFFLCFLKDAF